MIPLPALDRHLRMFGPERWVVLAVDQGLQGIGGPPIHHPSRWDWGKAMIALLRATGVKVMVQE